VAHPGRSRCGGVDTRAEFSKRVLCADKLPDSEWNSGEGGLGMSRLLEDLFKWYVQDFDIVFERDTDPIDVFCQQHTDDEQRQLLKELRELYDDVLHGRASMRTILDMGLGYVPEGKSSPEAWLPRLGDYLERKIEAK
jgi:hypothetical protein